MFFEFQDPLYLPKKCENIKLFNGKGKCERYSGSQNKCNTMQVAIILVSRRDLLDPCIQQPKYAVYIAFLKVYVNT